MQEVTKIRHKKVHLPLDYTIVEAYLQQHWQKLKCYSYKNNVGQPTE